MMIKHSGTGKEFKVSEDAATRIKATLSDIYDEKSVYNLPLECWCDGDIVVDAGYEATRGPQAFTNGH